MSSTDDQAPDERIEQLLDVVMRIAAGDVDARATQSDRGDNLDALICGINMLAEEIGRTLSDTEELARELVAEKDKVIRAQAAAMAELSTPVIQLTEGVLVLPLIGKLDAERARRIDESLLGSIADRQAEVVILDITGVPVIDTAVANHLIQTMAACGLLGARVILSGVSPQNAETVVRLGVDMQEVRTAGSLESALTDALGLVHRRIVRVPSPSPQRGGQP